MRSRTRFPLTLMAGTASERLRVSGNTSLPYLGRGLVCSVAAVTLLLVEMAAGQPSPPPGPATIGAATTRPVTDAATLEARFSRQLSGATLEGSYTIASPDQVNAGDLSPDRYTLRDVRKVDDRHWLFEAKMPIAGQELIIPLHLPVEWAGDTPVIVLDDFAIPGMGVFSARVLFYDGHYCGYWKHGERGGTLFGVIKAAAQ